MTPADPRACPNCGAPGVARYCPTCGQRNVALDPTLSEWFSEALGDIFTFDSRIFRSLIPLLFRPGKLTREYVEGRRARYVSPLRMYLAVSLVLFAVISIRGTPMVNVATERGESSRGVLTILPPVDQEGNVVPADSLDGMPRMMAELLVATAEDPDQLNQELRGLFPKLMFVLVPVFALLLMALYRRQRRLYVHHLAFALHFHAFAFFVWAVVGIMGRPPDVGVRSYITLALVFATLGYLYAALKVVYEQGWFKTLVKTQILLLVYLLVFLAGMLTLVGLTLAFG